MDMSDEVTDRRDEVMSDEVVDGPNTCIHVPSDAWSSVVSFTAPERSSW